MISPEHIMPEKVVNYQALYVVLVNALLDTGSAVNLLPYDIGLQLGAIWEEQTVRLPLAGNLASVNARGLFVAIQIGHLEPVRQAFAWAQVFQVPLILG
jgi:hypothetical protein